MLISGSRFRMIPLPVIFIGPVGGLPYLVSIHLHLMIRNLFLYIFFISLFTSLFILFCVKVEHTNISHIGLCSCMVCQLVPARQKSM